MNQLMNYPVGNAEQSRGTVLGIGAAGLLLLLLVLLFIGRGNGGGGNGNGNGGGPAEPGGAIGEITLSQRFGQTLQKRGDENVNIDYQLCGGTVDSEGQPIHWTYEGTVQVIDTDTEEVVQDLPFHLGLPPQCLQFNSVFNVPDFAPPGKTFAVIVILEAAESDPNGEPLDTFVEVDILQADTLIEIIA